MYLRESHLFLSPSDLNNFVACRHLTALDQALLRGEIPEPEGDRDPIADLLSEKGDEHELAYLETLRAEGHEIVDIAAPGKGLEALQAAADETAAAMRAGAEVIYQATFVQPGPPVNGTPSLYRAHADFLFRVDDKPSDLGDYSYEVADAKLARRAKPYFLVQLCFYSELVEAVQGAAPEHVHVILGTGETETYRLAEFAAYFRQVRKRFLASLGAAPEETYPEPVPHCRVCKWATNCDERRIADDHLSLVAGLPSTQRKRLNEAGITTLAELGQLAPGAQVDGIRAEQLEKRRHQAALQLETREHPEDGPALALLEPEPNRGFARMPEPSDGDVFFDLEGDPFFDGGLEYLWGFVTADEDFTVWWGRDRDEEREAFERFVDYVVERLETWPDLHVYHYAAYEISALKRLAGGFGSREAEVDELLRKGVFVDLYRVVAESMRIGMPSYSLKKVEAFYMAQRETEVTDGNDSVIEFERWLDEGGIDADKQEILDAIAAYNRDDCLSTLRLRNWLLLQRTAAAEQYAREIEWFVPEESARSDKTVELDAETAALVDELCGELEEDKLDKASAQERTEWLVAQLLGYHAREARPVWWAFFDRRGSEPDALIDDADCIGSMSTTGEPAEPVGRGSLIHRFTFPTQETKMRDGSTVHDVAFGEKAGQIISIDRDLGELALKRGPSLTGPPCRRHLMPGGPYGTDEQRAALRRFAGDVIDRGLDADGRYRACRDLLLARAPRVRGVQAGEPLYANATDVEELRDLVARMDDTCLVIQGPPGSGKTYTGARLITSLIDAGKRVGVTSTSHKVIHNMLDEIEEVATEEGVEFIGLKKASAGRPDSEYESTHIGCTKDNGALTDPAVKLTADTAWHYARDEVDGTLDYLFIDEAGQVSLADALALGTAARNIVLLGDPQQLAQVTQAAHPDGAAVSALEHVLGDDQTIPPDRGIFLDKTWRLHPDIASFCSELMYDGRLSSAPGREEQRLIVGGGSMLDGTGLRWCPVEHEGDSQSSIAEAEAIAGLVAELRGASVVDSDGDKRSLDLLEDVLVVTPYNAQVKCLESRLPAGMRIGTIDKFQGQEAEIVCFSLATSSGAEIPRGLEFLLSRNRLNVAVSRARCVAVVVASPGLLDVDCRTVGQMRLVNAVYRVGEVNQGAAHRLTSPGS